MPELNKKDKIDELLKNAEDSDESNSINAIKSKNKKSFHKWPIMAGVVALIAVIGLAVMIPHSKNTQKLNSNSGSNNSQNSTAVADGNDGSYLSQQAPVKLKDWQKVPYNEQQTKSGKPTKQLQNAMNQWINKNPQASNTLNSGFVSESNGFTDNTKNHVLKNGKDNPNYSFLTQENVKYVYASYINRLINPQFGNWSLAQFAENDPKSLLSFNEMSDMFTPNWWFHNIKDGKDYSNIPVFADWNKDNYGHLKFVHNAQARWYGTLTYQKISPASNKNGSFKNIVIKNGVKYKAFLANGSTVTRKGTLNLTLVENNTNLTNPQNRLLISSAKLSMK